MRKPNLRIAEFQTSAEAAAVCLALADLEIQAHAKESTPPGRFSIYLDTPDKGGARDLIAGFRAGSKIGADVFAFLLGVQKSLIVKFGEAGEQNFYNAASNLIASSSLPEPEANPNRCIEKCPKCQGLCVGIREHLKETESADRIPLHGCANGHAWRHGATEIDPSRSSGFVMESLS